jgi:putative phosphonate metabolism protein
MPEARYAIYFVPERDSALYELGAALLGYDAYSGERLPFPEDLAFSEENWSELTREPRVYGFHATLKAPFRLAHGRREDEIVTRLKAFARKAREVVLIPPALRQIEGFAALVPGAPSTALDQLAGDCVQAFEDFRAPLNEAELQKRLASPLTPAQKENLERWGYPHVFETFRFHMTLTGRIAPADAPKVLAYLGQKLCGIEGKPMPIDRIALLCQPSAEAPFRLIANEPFSTD